jgi:hypothetical protein
MSWPGSNFTQPQHWRQFDSAAVNVTPANFVPLSVPYTRRAFIGFQRSEAWQAILGASSQSSAYAIAQNGSFGCQFHGPRTSGGRTALYMSTVTCDNSVSHVLLSSSTDCITCRAASSSQPRDSVDLHIYLTILLAFVDLSL